MQYRVRNALITEERFPAMATPISTPPLYIAMSLTRLGLESGNSTASSKIREARVPVAGVAAGSYARCIEDGVADHVNIVRLAAEFHT